MTYPEVQFVAAPEDGAEVLFDFNDGAAPFAETRVVADGFTLGTPSILGNPDGLGVEYGPRVMSFTLEIAGNRQEALQTQASLARAFMLRRRGWLRVQLDEFTSPVWLRTYTPTPGELDFDLVFIDGTTDRWAIGVQVAAEPFIRGERVDLWAGTINNNPAAATNPMGITLPTVVGDAPAPLRIEAAFSVTRNQSDILWATSAVPDGYSPIVWQIGAGDTWTVGADTSAPVVDAAFSGGSYRRVTFTATETLSTRLAGPAPAAVTPGRYRVFLRMGRDNTAGHFAFRLGYRTLYGGDIFGGSRTTIMNRHPNTSPVHATYVDLGDFTFPAPSADIDMASAPGIPEVALQVQRIVGTANCILDALVLLPVDIAAVTTLEPWEKSDMLVSSFSGQGPQAVPGEVQVWDGDAELSLRMGAGGTLDAIVSPANQGRFPTVRPGANNRLALIQQTRLSSGDFGVLDNSDTVTASAAVTVSYQPRWLWLGDS